MSSPELFVSYRRSNASVSANLVANIARERFGDDAVFLDQRDMPPGADLPSEIIAALRRARVALVVMEPGWIDVREKNSPAQRRIDAADDWCRKELETAFESGAVIIPVLVDGAGVPSREELPVSIAGLADKLGFEANTATIDRDLDQLMDELVRAYGFRPLHADPRAVVAERLASVERLTLELRRWYTGLRGLDWAKIGSALACLLLAVILAIVFVVVHQLEMSDDGTWVVVLILALFCYAGGLYLSRRVFDCARHQQGVKELIARLHVLASEYRSARDGQERAESVLARVRQEYVELESECSALPTNLRGWVRLAIVLVATLTLVGVLAAVSLVLG